MLEVSTSITGLMVALGAGLLIGAERERRKGTGPGRASAGVRTFVVATLLGALSITAGGELLLCVASAGIIAIACVSYVLSGREDPGLTSELALVACVPIGALAMREPTFAAAAAVTVAVVLAARGPLHRFVAAVVTEQEMHSALIFAAATLVVLPAIPDVSIGPFGAINPRSIWLVVIVMMAISAGGYMAVRALGVRYGLALAGFASGFVSSTATIAAMGARAKQTPELLIPAVAAGVASTLATVVQLVALLALTSERSLTAMAVSLACAGVVALAYAGVFARQAFKAAIDDAPDQGQAFDVFVALKLAAILAVIMLISAAMSAWFGTAGVTIAAAIAGFADTHAPAISAGQLVNANKLRPDAAVTAILLGMTTNTISKAIVAYTSGGADFAVRVIPGLILVIAAAWLGRLFV